MVLFFPEAALRPLSAGTPHTARLSSEHCGFGLECPGPAVQAPQWGAPHLPAPRAGAVAWLGSPGAGGASGCRRVRSPKTTPGSLLEHFPVSTEMTETGRSPRPPREDFLEVGAGGGAAGGLAFGLVASFQVDRRTGHPYLSRGAVFTNPKMDLVSTGPYGHGCPYWTWNW